MIHHDWPCFFSTQKKTWFSSDFGGTPSTQKCWTKRHLGETKFSDRAEFSRTSSKALMCGWVNGGWWCFVFFGSPQSYLDDGFGGWYFWMVIREVLFLFLFLVCTCSFVLLLRVFTSSESCPPLPSRLLLPLLLLYIPLLLLLLPLLPSSPSTQCAEPVVPIASKTVYGCLRYYSRLQSTGSSHRTHAVLNWSSWHGTPPLPYPALPPELYLRPY